MTAFLSSINYNAWIVPVLLQAIRDPSPLVRSAAAAALQDVSTSEAVQALVEALKCGRSGIVMEMPPGPDLKHSVTPKYDLLDLDIYETMAIQFSRGCPFRCEFCDITLMFGRSVRTKAPQQVLKELHILYDLGWRKGILFVDDNFIGRPLSAKALLRELIGPGVRSADEILAYDPRGLPR